MIELTIAFEESGATCIYDDALAPTLEALGDVVVTRASHVEPSPGGGWTAAMVDGPVLGPYRLRSEALDAEREWLKLNRGL